MARWRCWFGLVLLSAASCRRGNDEQRPAQKLLVASALSAAPRRTLLAGENAAAVASGLVAAEPVLPAPSVAVPPPGCVPQLAQQFLIDAHLRTKSLMTAAGQAVWWATLQRSIRYRTEQYGYYKGFGSPAWNPRPLSNQMRLTKFEGVSVVLHERVSPVLRCVELAIARDCADVPYRPRSLAGVRQTNTYFGGDVTNHVYGIALDIDPSLNPCCNCVEPWRSNPRCRGTKTDLERMAMPRCWIDAFEQYGFYWLGHDELKDTMHFEFLGDPAKIPG